MKNFYLIARSNSQLHEKYICRLSNYINSQGGICQKYHAECPDNNDSVINVPKDTECIISIGGDGTVVSVAHSISPSSIPIIGLNCGHLGYLCDMSQDNVEHCLDMLLGDAYKIEQRMMLEAAIEAQDNTNNTALNDVVIRGTDAGSSVISLTVRVNGIKLYSHDCDGLIVSTPTGSTAYNLSANGPIVSPHAECIILTPINPHTLNSRSIILNDNDVVDVNIASRRGYGEEAAYVLFDGMNRKLLKQDETLRINNANKTTRMVMLENVNFLERIRARMQEI